MREVSIAFGGPSLLDRASFGIERGERVCLLGRNGAGKSTVMRILDGTIAPDEGEVVRQTGIAVARLEQEVPDGVEGSIYDVVAAGLGETGRLLARYHQASHGVAMAATVGGDGGTVGTDDALRELDRLHHQLDAAGAWEVQSRVETVLQHLGLDADAPFASASGGRKRQALLARALVRDPDVLLLDEPTNHLDVAAIEWMERFLMDRGVTLLFVTHDRAFLRRLATRIVELDRGKLVDWGADYDGYLERKEAALAAEERERAEFDRRIEREAVRLRSSITARRTLNEGRARMLESMRRERAERRERAGTVRMQAHEAERSGRLVAEARGVSFSRGSRAIVRDLTTTIMRGDRVGLIGPNGSGKTTLLRLLLGELEPDAGTIRMGTGLEVAYFDQMREQLDPERTVFDSIADGAEFVTVGGSRRHVNAWLQDFLFPPERGRTPVRALSGGERNRLLLARLFTRSFNLLVLDEPTNDLDLETLELLEALLIEYGGTLLLVSHDRDFLDNVVTSTLVFEGDGRVGEYVGGYSDWVRQRPEPPADIPVARRPERAAPPPQERPERPERPERRRRLTFRETQELAALPGRIEALEGERERLYATLMDPEILRDGTAVAASRARLDELETEIEEATERWVELETVATGE
ncbi:MAG TPA: ATP-binding cassette domain-containing protein [Gemmatimonadales bacterium]